LDWSAERTVDARGVRCPLPVLRARKALLAMRPGDPLSAIDVPHFCSQSGHRLVASQSEGEALRYLIERV
jgi:tRNA 2-thiouridine synthesizing protein A